MDCTVYIDESGDTGISKVRNRELGAGSSPYFVMSAAVLPRATQIQANRILDKVEIEIKRTWKHSTDLNHSQRVFLCRAFSTLNARYFAVISNKATLSVYKDMIENAPHKFYNKCAIYLLERVGKYLLAKGISLAPRVIFEKRNHDYDALRRYFGKIKNNPQDSQAQWLRVFNPFSFVALPKKDERLLKVADLVANAVYQCVNKSNANFGIPEPRYVLELAARFGADERGRVEGTGLKFIHSIEQLELDREIKDALLKMRALPLK